MKFLSPRNRIALGLTGAVLAVICLARFAGLIPDREKQAVASRAELTETVALGTSGIFINGGEASLEPYLQGIVERNEQVLSTGVRNNSGKLLIEVGEHKDNWDLGESEESNQSMMFVPIFESAEKKWGTVELRFKKLRSDGVLGLLQAMDYALMLFVGSVCFCLFSFLLRLILRHLDPSKAVPQRVRDALDNLAEGLMILDTKNNVLLANNSLAKVVGTEPDRLIGQKPATFGFQLSSEIAADFPWKIALDEKRLVSNTRLQLVDPNNSTRSFLANCSPLIGHKGHCCGVMVTLDDVTMLEESRVQLSEARGRGGRSQSGKKRFLGEHEP